MHTPRDNGDPATSLNNTRIGSARSVLGKGLLFPKVELGSVLAVSNVRSISNSSEAPGVGIRSKDCAYETCLRILQSRAAGPLCLGFVNLSLAELFPMYGYAAVCDVDKIRLRKPIWLHFPEGVPHKTLWGKWWRVRAWEFIGTQCRHCEMSSPFEEMAQGSYWEAGCALEIGPSMQCSCSGQDSSSEPCPPVGPGPPGPCWYPSPCEFPWLSSTDLHLSELTS